MDQEYNLDLSPAALSSTASELVIALDKAIDSVKRFGAETGSGLEKELQAQCQKLYGILSQLQLIFLTYTKHWSPDNLEIDPPLDPMIYNWISDCTLTVLGLQTEVDRQSEGVNEDGFVEVAGPGEDEEMELKRLSAQLKEHTNSMSDFLPILRCDLDEFLNSNIGRTEFSQRFENDASFRSPKHETAVDFLRSALYSLNDEIKTSLAGLQKNDVTADARDDVKALQPELSRCITALTEVLTNHSSEWIESMLNGRMTYAEFCQIDTRKVQKYEDVFKEFNRLFSPFWERGHWVSLKDNKIKKDDLEEAGIEKVSGTVRDITEMLKA